MAARRAGTELNGAPEQNGSVDLSAEYATVQLSSVATKEPLVREPEVPTAEKAVVVSGLGKSFGAVHALRDVSFDVDRGEVVALLGPNGAGKTTTVNILSTLARPDRGHATVAGFDVVSEAAGVRQSIMLTGQHVALDDMLTARENLILFGRLRDLSSSESRSRAEELLHKFDLAHAAHRRVGTFSGGMRRRIDIACGLVVPPEVVFLDEPTTGLDPRSRQTIWDLVADFKNLGIATLLTTQYLEEADLLSDRIIVIDHGVIVAEGTADELKERTGGGYCEITPRDRNDLHATADALGSLMPEQNKAALTSDSDRVAVPAPDGVSTLIEAMSRLSAAHIELADIQLRRPSLDDVFLSLTNRQAGFESDESDQSAVDEPIKEPWGHIVRGASARRVLSPVLCGLLVGGIITALELGGQDANPDVRNDREAGLQAAPVIGSAQSGDCLNWPANAPGQPSFVQCQDDHLFEVADSFDMRNPAAPCQLAVQRYLGSHYDPNGKFTMTALWPDKVAETHPEGRRILCGLQLLGPDGQPVPFKGQVAQLDQSKVWPTGTCLGIDPANNQPTDTPVDCAAPHAVEVTGTANLDESFGGRLPAQGEQDAFLEEACARMADEYLAPGSLMATGLTVHYTPVSPAGWLAGSRQVSCGIGATLSDNQGWATLTGTGRGGQLVSGLPPAMPAVAPEIEENTTDLYLDTPTTVTETPPPVAAQPSPPAPRPTTSPLTTAPPNPQESATPTSENLPPGGVVIAVPGFVPITLTPLPPPAPPEAPPPLPPPGPSPPAQGP